MYIVVTIPAYNEEKSIGRTIERIRRAMKNRRCRFSILVVDDGSRDHTAAVAKKAGAEVIVHPVNLGLAETFRTEMTACLKKKADIIVHIDADAQYLPREIPKLIDEVEDGYDLVLGSRFKGHIERMPWLKRRGNRAFSRVISQITRLPISDAQTGFRAFTREVAEIAITSTFTYTQEQIIRAARMKFHIKEVPVYFAARGGTKSRLMKHPLDYALKAGINLLRVYRDYEPLKFFGLIGLSFFGVGILLGIWIVYTIITTGGVGGIPRVILSAVLLITAVQIWVFGFLADMWRR